MGLISLLLDVTSFRDVPFANHMKVEYLGTFYNFLEGVRVNLMAFWADKLL